MAEAAARPRPARPWRRLLRWVMAGAALLGLLVGVLNAYVIATARGQIAGGVDSAPARPVAIVLGNRVYVDGRVSPDLGERLQVALELYRTGRAGRVIVSGAVWSQSYDEPRVMAAWLIQRGMPAQAVSLDRTGYRTAATMANAAAAGVGGALVCTQGYHLPRALYLARHAGIDAVGVPARDARRMGYGRVLTFVRETAARAEAVIEVALRGVKAS